MKAARAALMQVPILGIYFLLLPIRPDQGSVSEYAYEVFAAISSSFQVSPLGSKNVSSTIFHFLLKFF